MDEQYVEIEGYPNYMISNLGNVVNIQHNRDLKPTPDYHGMLYVQLWNEGYKQTFYVHRLVAKGFFLYYDEGVQVGFVSDDYHDCSVANLHITDRRVRGRV